MPVLLLSDSSGQLAQLTASDLGSDSRLLELLTAHLRRGTGELSGGARHDGRRHLQIPQELRSGSGRR